MPKSSRSKARKDDPIEKAVYWHDCAVRCRADGQFKRAEAAARRSLQILERCVGSNHPDTANVRNTLGGLRED